MPPALTSGEPGSSFQQQGTVDWGQLASRTATFSIDVLSRLSAANVDPYTLEIGRIMCNQFQLSQEGQRNVQNALSTLYSHRLPGTLLWFGFGARHVVRQLPSTHQGFTCVALCGVLADYYHPDIAAEILSEMIKLLSLSPDILTPSILEWRNLVQACSGVFAASSFGTLVEELLQLNPYIWTLEDDLHVIESPRATRDGCASPRSIAEVLQAIGRVSCGKLENIEVVGGNDIGWLASLSEWLFGLRLRIENADGIGLYSNYDLDTAHPQVTLKYSPRRQNPSAKPPSSELAVVSRTFVLEDATNILRYRPDGESLISNTGRIPWNNLLSRTFGSDFQDIMEQDRQTLATIFGSAARFLLGFVSAEPSIDRRFLGDWKYNSGAYGRGFIQTLTERLPELATLKVAIENSFKGSFDEAKKTYETHILRLRLNCNCVVCKPEDGDSWGFCRVVIAETIIELAVNLSVIEITDGLYPKRRGLERLYEIRKAERMAHVPVKKTDGTEDPIPLMFRVSFKTRSHNNISRILESCIQLFTGYRSYVDATQSAISMDGIVIHAQILHKLSDNPEVVGKVFVGAGCIEHEGRRFFSIVDAQQPNLQEPKDIWDSIQQYDQSKIVITQTIRGLEFQVELKASQQDALPVVRVRPCGFAAAVAGMRGLINCTGRDCMQVCSGAESASGWFDFSTRKVRVVRGDSLTRTVAIHLLSSGGGFAGLIADNSCLQCCLKWCEEPLYHTKLVIVIAEDG